MAQPYGAEVSIVAVVDIVRPVHPSSLHPAGLRDLCSCDTRLDFPFHLYQK